MFILEALLDFSFHLKFNTLLFDVFKRLFWVLSLTSSQFVKQNFYVYRLSKNTKIIKLIHNTYYIWTKNKMFEFEISFTLSYLELLAGSVQWFWRRHCYYDCIEVGFWNDYIHSCATRRHTRMYVVCVCVCKVSEKRAKRKRREDSVFSFPFNIEWSLWLWLKLCDCFCTFFVSVVCYTKCNKRGKKPTFEFNFSSSCCCCSIVEIV